MDQAKLGEIRARYDALKEDNGETVGEHVVKLNAAVADIPALLDEIEYLRNAAKEASWNYDPVDI